MSATDTTTMLTVEALMRDCRACGARPGEPCLWGVAMTQRWGRDARLHAHFVRLNNL